MNSSQPTFETVFTEAYWGDVEDLSTRTNNNGLIPADTLTQMQNLTGQAAGAIFRGEPRLWVPVGTQLGIPGESHYTLPGNVVLVDLEGLTPDKLRPSEREIRRDGEHSFPYQRFIHNEGELMALPSTMFMRNSIRLRDGQVIQVLPYRKSIPRGEDGRRYVRTVRFFAYGLDRKNNPAARMLSDWNTLPEGNVEGAGTPRDALVAIPAFVVGESFRYGKDILRVKSAQLCISGLLEPVKVKQKRRRGVFAGRLATSSAVA